MTETTPSPRGSLGTVAVLLSSLLIAFPLFVSKLVEAILKGANPAKVDITQGLAYLRELLGFGFGSLGVLIVAIVVVYVLLYRQSRSFATLKLPLLILVVQVVAGVLILVFTGSVNNAVDSYVGALG